MWSLGKIILVCLDSNKVQQMLSLFFVMNVILGVISYLPLYQGEKEVNLVRFSEWNKGSYAKVMKQG